MKLDLGDDEIESILELLYSKGIKKHSVICNKIKEQRQDQKQFGEWLLIKCIDDFKDVIKDLKENDILNSGIKYLKERKDLLFEETKKDYNLQKTFEIRRELLKVGSLLDDFDDFKMSYDELSCHNDDIINKITDITFQNKQYLNNLKKGR